MFNCARLLTCRTFNKTLRFHEHNGRLLVKSLRHKFPNLKGLLGAHGFHCGVPNPAKVFVDRENTYAFNIVENICVYPKTLQSLKHNTSTDAAITTHQNFDAFMDQEFRKQSATQIFTAFKQIAAFCKLNSIDFADPRFDKLTDGLMDNVERLTDNELFELLDVLAEFPECESFKSHNFHDIWSALDDLCCWRLPDWDKETQFFIADKWYRLKLGKVSDYIFDFLGKLVKRAKYLTKNELVHAFFFMNVCRKRTLEFEYESAVEKNIEDMTLDEIAVIALGYFKTQSKVKISHVCSTMIRKTMEADNIHEMTLCAILKVLRYSSHTTITDQIYLLLDHLAPQLNRFSTLCLLHAALLGTTLQIKHEPSLRIAAQRIAEHAGNVVEVRLKDIERILLPLTMFDYDPETDPDLYETTFKEIHQERRRGEIAKYRRCMPSALLFFSIRGMYSHELMDMVLDKDFIVETYGKSSKMIPREIFSLDLSVDIECPDYKGNRLSDVVRHKAAKWLTSYSPSQNQKKKISKADAVVLKAEDVISGICGGKKYYLVEHVLPHFAKADIIICKDLTTNKFVPPKGLEQYTLGDVMRPPKTDKLQWYAFVVVGWNTTIRNTSLPVGLINMKIRQLEKIGYKAVPVIWNEFMPLSSTDQLQYLLKKL